ncbi:MAG TPA: DUF4288 domain-containing protein [Thermoanaerobaculia bacterium]|nr:DUF4288 domain-containing protein [Thermoanaerobaculia bacterium]
MSWFMAVIVRGAHVDGTLDDERIGDLLYRLVEASDAEAAYQRALALGRAAVDEYDDEDGTHVTLGFLGLADLTEIGPGPLEHGTEVYSQLLHDKPSEMAVETKEDLTIFEPEEPEGNADEDGAGPSDR